MYQLTMLAVPHLINTRGNIVNVSSVNALRPVSFAFATLEGVGNQNNNVFEFGNEGICGAPSYWLLSTKKTPSFYYVYFQSR